jgi:hypothetical protein
MSAPDRVTCPVCQRPNRALTKAGKIREHDVPPGIGHKLASSRWCPAGGLTVEESEKLSQEGNHHDH